MTIEYKASSHVSFDVYVNGGKRHISFSQATGGGSYFRTSDEDLIRVLDNPPIPGLYTRYEVKEVIAKPAAAKPETNFATIKVSCLDDAKEYIANRFGISRSMLRSKASILNAAKDNNIVFEGLE